MNVSMSIELGRNRVISTTCPFADSVRVAFDLVGVTGTASRVVITDPANHSWTLTFDPHAIVEAVGSYRAGGPNNRATLEDILNGDLL